MRVSSFLRCCTWPRLPHAGLSLGRLLDPGRSCMEKAWQGQRLSRDRGKQHVATWQGGRHGTGPIAFVSSTFQALLRPHPRARPRARMSLTGVHKDRPPGDAGGWRGVQRRLWKTGKKGGEGEHFLQIPRCSRRCTVTAEHGRGRRVVIQPGETAWSRDHVVSLTDTRFYS